MARTQTGSWSIDSRSHPGGEVALSVVVWGIYGLNMLVIHTTNQPELARSEVHQYLQRSPYWLMWSGSIYQRIKNPEWSTPVYSYRQP